MPKINNELQLLGEELEREIIMIHQALSLKSSQLNETRKKLRKEIVEHQMVKNLLDKKINEMEDKKIELELNSKANAKLDEENAKYRESISKLQTQVDLYTTERQLLTDRCHNADIEICKLRSQVGDLEDKLQEHLVEKELHDQYRSDTKNLIDRVLSKQETLNKEQIRLEKTVKDALAFAAKLSEELNIQSLFVKEANIARVRLENETIRLIGVLEEERNEKRKLLELVSGEPPKPTYLADWKSSEDEMSQRIRFLTEENRKLVGEVEELKAQLDLVLEKDL